MNSTRDTRPIHEWIFRELTPAEYPHFAGHYRGEALPCLENYGVEIPGDDRVGYHPAGVGTAMAALSALIGRAFAALDVDSARGTQGGLSVGRVVAAAAVVFQNFLTIHPYADGNGHAARFCVWAMLVRYGYWPLGFTIEPRPGCGGGYVEAIKAHRDGNPEPLEDLILDSLLPTVEGTGQVETQ